MRIAALAVAAALSAGGAAAQDRPLSAIDWLSASVAPAAPAPARPAEPPVTADAASPEIVVTALDGPGATAIGPETPEALGLPSPLWSGSDAATALAAVRAAPADSLPSAEDLLTALLLAAAAPPPGGEALPLARVDRLLEMGDLADAEALLRSGDLLDPEWFRRFFDVTLLEGTEDEACGMLRDHPTLAPTLEARVFCLARNGDWPAAALTLNTARALGDVSDEEDALLSHFLDPEATPAVAAEGSRPSPLTYRIREAVGDLVPTTGLPLAFSHADLRSTVAWRAQIEAAERLARRGALDPERLREAWLARTPAASGGVWDRVAAAQALDAAVAAGDRDAASAALLHAWPLFEASGLQAAAGRLWGRALLGLDLDGAARAPMLEAALLSDDWQAAAEALDPGRPAEAGLRAVALGGEASDDGAALAAILAGLSADPPEAAFAAREDGTAGVVAAGALDLIGRGLDGDRDALARGLATLRGLGLEDRARRIGLEALILGDAA